MSRLKEKYNKEIRTELFKEKDFNYKSIMQVPQIKKIVINVGAGEATTNSKVLDSIVEELTLITGQKPVKTFAKKSIAGFKLREGQAIGVKVTLRGQKMYHFLDKLISAALPRVRDFKGVNKKGFDKEGNYTLGIKEQLIFPEIDYDKVSKVRGMNITIVTSSKNAKETKALLDKMGMPFEK